MRQLALISGFLGLALAPAQAGKNSEFTKEIQIIAKQGRGTPEGRAAWDRMIMAGPGLLPDLLKAMDTPDTVAANWFRAAFDHIVEKEWKKDKAFDTQAILNYARDPSRQGRARRLALELLEKIKPGTSAALYPGWMEDPEFRYEAVDLVLEKARLFSKEGARDQAVSEFRTAFAASRDVLQGRKAAAGLLEHGIQVSVANHLGFLMDWRLVGPFDAKGMKGFNLEYPPEKHVDLQAEYEGQNGKVRWKSYKVREPSPTSGARHQALVDLRVKEALGDADDAVAFAYTEFLVPRSGEAEFRGAADDNFTVWVNGKKAFGFEEYRNGVRLDRHRFKVMLREGTNTVLVKICQTPAPNPEPNWEFFLRVVDSTGKGIEMKNGLP